MTPEELNQRLDASDTRDRVGHLILDSPACLVALVDRDHRILFANDAFCSRFGEDSSRLCYEAFKRRDAPCDNCVAERTRGDGRQHVANEQGVTATNKLLCYQVRAVPYSEENGRVEQVLLIAVDTTRLMELEGGMACAEQLARVGLSAAGLAHTVKNILGGLEGGEYMIESGLEKGDITRIGAGWKMAKEYLEQVGRLVKNLLQYARPRQQARAEVALGPLIEELEKLYASKAIAAGLELSHRVEPGTPRIVCDRDAISATVANLVANAIDACAWDPDLEKQHAVEIVAAPKAGGACIAVQDNGMGISPDNQRKILEASFTTKGMRGTGLGLLLAKRALQDHGGRIDFESTPGQGSVFRVELPAAPKGGSP
jgi:signal transduction histidine kinase